MQATINNNNQMRDAPAIQYLWNKINTIKQKQEYVNFREQFGEWDSRTVDKKILRGVDTITLEILFQLEGYYLAVEFYLKKIYLESSVNYENI